MTQNMRTFSALAALKHTIHLTHTYSHGEHMQTFVILTSIVTKSSFDQASI